MHLQFVFAALFIFLLVQAVVSDMSRLLIPNWISIALVALFVAYLPVSPVSLPVVGHMLVACAAFAVGLGLYAHRWMAGGDVKLFAAVALWAGPAGILKLLMVTALAGAGLALLVGLGIAYLHWSEAGPLGKDRSRFFPRWVKHGLVPYGFAIGAGALATIPAGFF